MTDQPTRRPSRIAEAAADVVVLVGCAAIAYGAWLVVPAAGFITGGVEGVALGVMLSIRSRV